jgi:hypothetical protein
LILQCQLSRWNVEILSQGFSQLMVRYSLGATTNLELLELTPQRSSYNSLLASHSNLRTIWRSWTFLVVSIQC